MNSSYYEQERPEVLSMVPHHARRVLELGCAGGAMAAALKRRQGGHVTGVEYVAEVATRAAQRLDRVIVGDCEQLDLDAQFEPGEFDCVIAADVLEHLRDPEALLRRLKPFLCPDAALVASIPNVRHAGVLQNAVRGYWTYQDWGILDRTHLRFFTWREIDHMLTRLGFQVEARATVDDPSLADWERLGRPVSAAFGAMSVHGLDEREIREFFVVQWLIRARLAGNERLAPTTAEISQDGNSHPPAVEWPAISVERDSTRELAARVLQERAESERLRSELDAAHGQLALLRRSMSWRLTAPLRGAGSYPVDVLASLHGMAQRQRFVWRTGDQIAKVLVMAAALPRPGHVITALRAGFSSSASSRGPGHAPVLVPRPIPVDGAVFRAPNGGRGRLICMTQVLPYPPLSGSRYRIDHLLQWLSGQGWDVLLLVCPAANGPLAPRDVAEAAAHYPNMIVCQHDGQLVYRLRDGGELLAGIRQRRPRSFAQPLHEPGERRPAATRMLETRRTSCPDALIELLLYLESAYRPDVVLAEGPLMTRPFPLLRPGLLKIVDLMSGFPCMRVAAEQAWSEDDRLLVQRLEANWLNTADVLMAFQAVRPDESRQRGLRSPVIGVGIDAPVLKLLPLPAARPIVLCITSGDPEDAKGLRDLLRFAWPLVLNAIPEAELHVIGPAGDAADSVLPGVRMLGRVEHPDGEFAAARVVINPAVAGIGHAPKVVEALGHLRPVVTWPSGVEGLSAELRALSLVAVNWFDFACKVIQLAASDDPARGLASRQAELVRSFAPETVYAPLAAFLQAEIPQLRRQRPAIPAS